MFGNVQQNFDIELERYEERQKVIDEVIHLINKNCLELEGKRLKITPLLLCQEINELRGEYKTSDM